ncbi:HAD family acid phosphatase [Bradyrhizobium canariense]|uniref:HAD family acid phosphatase n=1 Tax=Bradyrhizobium canariense TaxID=255045 RepID=UPI001FCD5507|nr:HAD family acid phosphatase [Bradyrhizobium canariense]
MLVAPSSQPLNVGDAIIAATAYHDSAAYEREIAAITATAAAWINEVAPSTHKPAIVLDVDETALSNWTIIKRDDFGRPIGGPCPVDSTAPCGWAAWDMLASDTVIAPVLDLVSKARALGVKVFFITGRPESQRTATEKNLRAAGYIDFETLYMAPNAAHFASAADFKTPVRAAIETEGYTIIANIGDQPSDLYGGHAEKIFLLPNPFYRVP